MFFVVSVLLLGGFMHVAVYWHGELLRARREARWERVAYCKGYRNECLVLAGCSAGLAIFFATSA